MLEKIARATGIMKKLKYYVPPSVIRTLCFSLVFPHVTYGLPAWGKCGTIKQEKKK